MQIWSKDLINTLFSSQIITGNNELMDIIDKIAFGQTKMPKDFWKVVKNEISKLQPEFYDMLMEKCKRVNIVLPFIRQRLTLI
jgi:hypothetical protein